MKHSYDLPEWLQCALCRTLRPPQALVGWYCVDVEWCEKQRGAK